MVNPVWRT